MFEGKNVCKRKHGRAMEGLRKDKFIITLIVIFYQKTCLSQLCFITVAYKYLVLFGL